MTTQIELNEAFRIYSSKMNSIYTELNLLKESYSYSDYDLVIEGFWDKLKSFAGAAGSKAGELAGGAVNTVKKSVEFVKDLGQQAYDKGLELGKKAGQIATDLYNKVAKIVTKTIDDIKKFPGKVWANLLSISTAVGAEIAEIYSKAKDKGKEWMESFRAAAIKIYGDLAQKMTSVYETTLEWGKTHKEEFVKLISDNYDAMKQVATTAAQSAIKEAKELGSAFLSVLNKVKKGSIEAAKFTGLLTLGLIALPFVAGAAAAKSLYKLGKDLDLAIQNGLTKMKKELGEDWNLAIANAKSSYKAKLQHESLNFGRAVPTFESFINSTYLNERHEGEIEHYMFFQNLHVIKNAIDTILFMDSYKVDSILDEGHDWAADHIATAKESITQVASFLQVALSDHESIEHHAHDEEIENDEE